MKPIAIFLYSKSKIMAQPWADAGIECHLFDLGLRDSVDGNIIMHGGDLRKARKDLGKLCRNNRCLFMASFTPCTDLAVSGARHFEKKALDDAFFWAKAMELVEIGLDLAEFFEIPYLIENPKSMISTLLDRKPDFKFHPWEFGGYLPGGHQHCLYPEIYPGQDAYNKETWLWCGNGFRFPECIPVEPVGNDYPGWSKLGGKSERTKEIRSVTPEGFARAVFQANKPMHKETIPATYWLKEFPREKQYKNKLSKEAFLASLVGGKVLLKRCSNQEDLRLISQAEFNNDYYLHDNAL